MTPLTDEAEAMARRLENADGLMHVEPRRDYPHQGKREMQRRMRQMARQARNKP